MFFPSIVLAAFVSALSSSATLPAIGTNDNRTPAGTFADNTLRLNLRAAEGIWRPEGASGPALQIQAFGDITSSLVIPAPLIRVPEGTDIRATVRNDLSMPLRVHGLCDRLADNAAPGDKTACAPLEVPPGETRSAAFKAAAPGTYHYWATTTGMPFVFRAVGDTQLAGAFVVDPKGGATSDDRIFVITDWTSLTLDQLRDIARADDPGKVFNAIDPQFTFPINGLLWPATERLTYRVNDRVRWRVLNLTTQPHTMHLHGFYFEVDSLGDGLHSTHFAAEKQRIVTQLMPPGATLAMTWTPERAGNWLFHCHIRDHVSPKRRLALSQSSGSAAAADHAGHDDGSAGMAGMILGITVTAPVDATAAADAAPLRYRKLTLEMKTDPNRFGSEPAYGFVLSEGEAQPPAAVPIPGPTLVLRRGEPVEITLVNKLPEGTAIHWHGMELESYYDGVHGWSGTFQRVTPLIEPGQSFVVRFTPPRSGTFMYHTHMHDDRQLKSGLYGAMLVMDEGATYDAATDHVFLMGRSGPGADAPAVLNGELRPQTAWKAGVRHRIRLINITPSDVFTVSLQTTEGAVTWKPVAKDGAPLPPSRCTPSAAKQIIGVGETYDFEYEAAPGRTTLWLEVRSPGGKWMNQGLINVR
jgi:FtsP/CotA-like multicopper oxidase with cupredoxin domain